jgi:CheY-like chemotaxis protein
MLKTSILRREVARTPLGIIALFIVLVYGFAGLVTFSGILSTGERMPLIYFLIGFPILVLAVFTWLVSKHSSKLIVPGDFKNEAHYIEVMRLSAVASLAAAASKIPGGSSEADVKQLVELVRRTTPSTPTSRVGWRNHILWVDDRPDNNIHERRAFEAIGLRFTLAQSTKEALKELASQQFAAVISDMGRREGPTEGYVLLDTLRKQGNEIPLFFMPLQTHQSTNTRPPSMADRDAQTMHKSFSRWSRGQSLQAIVDEHHRRSSTTTDLR